jgi:two-component system sensor histidine kinase/response regulator
MADARLLKEIIKDTDFARHEITFVHSLEELDVFKKSHFDAILLDLHLSDVKPEETFHTVNRLFSSMPIIVLTGLKDDDLASKIVHRGAQDYLVKGTFDSETLQRALKYSMYRKRAEKKMASQKYASQKFKTKAEVFETESIRLAKINKAKDVFLSIASHQLRTPATAVKQYVGMVLEGYAGDLDDKKRDLLETAYQSNERQLKIVDDLLKVAKLDAGHVTLRKEPTDIVALLRDVIADQEQAISIKKQHVSLEPDLPVMIIKIDCDNMRMVFENLLDNASKYSEDGADIQISIRAHDKSVVCLFKDHGIGISREDQKKLFQKFSRIDDSFAYAPNGSGLGLYWAKEIVKLHNGSIRLNSVKGKGSTFEVVLPA